MAFDNPSLFEMLTSIKLKVLRELVIFLQQFSRLTCLLSTLVACVAIFMFIIFTSLCCLKPYCLEHHNETNNKNLSHP